MNHSAPVNHRTSAAGEFYDELPLWSARFGQLILDQVPLRSGMTILDIGAGTGWLSLELAQRCGAETTVIAVDSWEDAMQRLARKVDHLGLRNVRLLVQDAAAFDLPDASVDLIVSNLGINNFENREAVLQACFRVARPGAELFVTTNLVGHMREFYDVYRDVLRELGLADQVAALESHIHHRATIDSVRSQLESAGFQFVRAATHSFRERFVDGSALLRHYFIRLGFLPGWKEVVPSPDVERTFAALERRLNRVAAEHSELTLTVPGACIQARRG
ncbi:MAG: class I SAM-dependent methyltransferase [Planctomycetaceae bacterium]|nr:class I SAM-dependent methyltransferase [Planctomycetaceae bacterium]